MKNKNGWLPRLIFVLPVLIFLLSLTIGQFRIPLPDIPRAFLSLVFPSSYPGMEGFRNVLFQVRLPRLLLALAVGASLSVSGSGLQAVFRNPLANEYILGISSGAGFGAALSFIVLGRNFPPQFLAFVFALTAVLTVLLIARSGESQNVSLLLAGVIVSAFFSALLSLIEYFADPYSLQALFFWLMGSLSAAGWKDLAYSLPIMAAGATILILMRWRMNVLSLSEEEAAAIGVNARREKLLIVAAATLATAAATAVAGIIGWLGLIVPHLVRMMVGANNRRVVPLAAALGASFLLIADDITRGLASFEIPIGIFTSLIGIPLFVYLLKRSKTVWQ